MTTSTFDSGPTSAGIALGIMPTNRFFWSYAAGLPSKKRSFFGGVRKYSPQTKRTKTFGTYFLIQQKVGLLLLGGVGEGWLNMVHLSGLTSANYWLAK
jgi:hypothetical protein